MAQALFQRGQPITVVLYNPQTAAHWQQQGAKTAMADVRDTEALRSIFQQGRRLFLLKPPAPPATDMASEERRSVAALPGSGPERIVAKSTYGAQPGERLGGQGVLYELEQALAAQLIPASSIRAAYYMSSWEAALAKARQEGNVYILYPVGFS